MNSINSEIYQDGEWVAAVENEDAFDNHAYYQGYFNANGTMDYVFNIIRPSTMDFDESMLIKIYSQ